VILVIGSKGGVGATTVTAGLVGLATVRVAAVDLGVANDLVEMGDGRWRVQSLDAITRAPDGRLDEMIAGSLNGRDVTAFALSGQGRILRVEETARVLDLLESHRTLVADMGAQWLPRLMELATHAVLVMTPDPRSLRRAEQFMRQAEGQRLSIYPVLNFSGPEPGAVSFDEMISLPDSERISPLSDEAWQAALAPLAERLGLRVAPSPQAHPTKTRARSQRTFDWRRWVPRVRWVD